MDRSLLTVRTALVLLLAVLAGTAVGVLSVLAGEGTARAVLSALAAAGLSLPLAHRMIAPEPSGGRCPGEPAGRRDGHG
ncbi:hypothetical protein [Streptomyces sp. NPDC005955]|uniref:hypothetical protein n=1 Tax=Streptomyces sp. NPDC005955 TaxID=3364738 RepID=UPI00369BBD5B